jgi:RNA polymerase sigma-70 factor (ECF subfamily)
MQPGDVHEDYANYGSLKFYISDNFESADYLRKAAGGLPPVRKNIFLLKVIKGYSNKEIAEELSISVKTVEDHYSKAVRHLKSAPLMLLAIALAGF